MSKLPSAGSKDTVLMAISNGPSFNYTSHKKDAVAGYTLYAFIDNAEATAEHTFFNGQPAYLLDQTTQPKCFGDAAGIGGGVKSGTIGGEVKPISGSSTIFIEGKALVREGDACTMNNGNVKGMYVTVDAAQAEQIMAQWADQSTEQALADGGLWVGFNGKGGEFSGAGAGGSWNNEAVSSEIEEDADELGSLVSSVVLLDNNQKISSKNYDQFWKKGGGNDLEDFITPHSQKHAYDSSKLSTKNKSQFGQNVNVKALREDTIKNPDSVSTMHNITRYAKRYSVNISTPDTPTGEMRVFINHDKPDRSTQFPYVSRQKANENE